MDKPRLSARRIVRHCHCRALAAYPIFLFHNGRLAVQAGARISPCHKALAYGAQVIVTIWGLEAEKPCPMEGGRGRAGALCKDLGFQRSLRNQAATALAFRGEAGAFLGGSSPKPPKPWKRFGGRGRRRAVRLRLNQLWIARRSPTALNCATSTQKGPAVDQDDGSSLDSHHGGFGVRAST